MTVDPVVAGSSPVVLADMKRREYVQDVLRGVFRVPSHFHRSRTAMCARKQPNDKATIEIAFVREYFITCPTFVCYRTWPR